MTGTGSPRACDRIRVVDFSRGMAGPLASMVLADNGAEVVKVEPPEGDWARAHRGFHFWNRGKQSIVLDLQSSGRERADELLQWANVVITDFRPAVARRLALTEEDILRANPEILHCDISNFGGLMADDETHYEGTIAAQTGRMTGLDPLSGGLPRPTRAGPTFTLPPVASYAAGLLGVLGIVATQLDRPGRNHRVSTSLLQGAMSFMMREELRRGTGSGEAEVPNLMHRGIQLCFLTAECSDGRYIQMCARQDHHFRNWLRALGLETLLEDPRFEGAPLGLGSEANIDELERLLRDRMRTRTQAQWMELFTSSLDIGADPFITTDEFLYHPQMIENGRVLELDDPELGTTRQLGPLVRLDRTPARTDEPAPRLGQGQSVSLDRGDVVPTPDSAKGTVSPTAERHGPLSDVTILEVAYFVAGPLATTLLAELGARVVKIEPLTGDSYRRTGRQSAKFLHGKESIALDLKSDDGRQILHELIAESDVLVHGFRPGVPERLGMDEATARTINPDLVYLNAASYGSKGPESARIAFHSTPTALSGAGILQAGRGNPPVDDSFPDPAAGIASAVAIALGLLARTTHGIGQYLETTMICSTGYVMSGDLVQVDRETAARPADPGQHGLSATYRLYECDDGWIFLSAVREAEWRALTSVFEDLQTDERFRSPDDRRLHDGALTAALQAAFMDRRAEDIHRKLRSAGVPVAIACPMTFENWLIESGLLTPAEHPAHGRYWQLPHKITVDGNEDQLRPSCGLGEHTDAILTSLGRDEGEIARLRASSVVT